MISGITVTLLETASSSGVDGFNNPINQYITTSVDNVLVAPSSSDDIIDSTNMYGKKAIYTIGVPKGDNHVWEDAIVEFFGHKWHIFSLAIEGIEAMIPLSWNAKYYCERYNGEDQY